VTARIALALAIIDLAYGQTTEAVLTGRVVDASTGKRIPGAAVTCINQATQARSDSPISSTGWYTISPLPPGSYRIVASAPHYQPRELRNYEIPVSGLMVVDLLLRPVYDLWEAGQYRALVPPGSRTVSTIYGPDVDFSKTASFEPVTGDRNTLFASVSFVVTPGEIELLPLPGRDVYSTLLLQPGVVSSAATARGLGLSVNGQRYTSSNFLLDGLENNAYLTTGPLTTQTPEVVQEYRISTANFSPEYGRTSGFVVNAVTMAGGSRWHGRGYLNFNNELLNANEVARRYAGLPRGPVKELEPGAAVGGPISHQKLFGFFAVDHLRNRGRAPVQTVRLPSTAFVADVLRGNPNSPAYQLFSRYRVPAVVSTGGALSGTTAFEPTESIDRTQWTARVDWNVSQRQRFFARATGSRLERPDFIPSPYPDFTSPLTINSARVMAGWSGLVGGWQHELRLSGGPDQVSFERAQPGVPSLGAVDASLPTSTRARGVLLPSSPLLTDFSQSSNTVELAYSASRKLGDHLLKTGAGVLDRRPDIHLTQGQGRYLFGSLQLFERDIPQNFNVYLSRLSVARSTLALPASDDVYGVRQFDWFAQDSFRVSNRVILSAGVRYDYMGAPRIENSGVALVQLGSAGAPSSRIQAAGLRAAQPGEALYSSRPGSWQGRASLSLAIARDTTFLRGGYGLFTDRPFDNLWLTMQENDMLDAGAALGEITSRDYLQPFPTLLNTLYSRTAAPGRVVLEPDPSTLRVFAWEPLLRNPSLRSGFISMEHRLTREWTLSAYGILSSGRYLLTTDQVNRGVGPARQRPNASLPAVYYRSDDGFSSYRAFLLTSRWQTRHYTLQVNYSLTAARDNQSDALANEFDLLMTQTSGATVLPGRGTFTRNYDFRVDEGAADFDQRHNFVLYSTWRPPSPSNRFRWLFEDWTLSQIAAIRSGFPFTVYATPVAFNDPVRLLNNRANLLCSEDYQINQPLPQGQLLLRAECFGTPGVTEVGNTRRNQFYGPGLFNLDASLGRSFRIKRLGESVRVNLRADAYNLLNHANLNNPESRLYCTEPGVGDCGLFGQANYGRREAAPAFPAQKPLTESGRRIQLLLRVDF
jgi:hypothetical protein